MGWEVLEEACHGLGGLEEALPSLLFFMSSYGWAGGCFFMVGSFFVLAILCFLCMFFIASDSDN